MRAHAIFVRLPTQVRFFNRASGMHSERVPPSELPPSRTARSGDGVWIKTFDKATGLPFFFNNDTGESTWKQPSGVTFYEDEVASSSALSRPQFTELASVPPKTRAEVERAREFLVTKFGEWPPRRLKDILREVGSVFTNMECLSLECCHITRCPISTKFWIPNLAP